MASSPSIHSLPPWLDLEDEQHSELVRAFNDGAPKDLVKHAFMDAQQFQRDPLNCHPSQVYDFFGMFTNIYNHPCYRADLNKAAAAVSSSPLPALGLRISTP